MASGVPASAWLSNEDSDEYWCEGAKCTVEVEATDADEIRLGIVLGSEESDAATIYLSREVADHLARHLAAASITPVRLPVA